MMTMTVILFLLSLPPPFYFLLLLFVLLLLFLLQKFTHVLTMLSATMTTIGSIKSQQLGHI